MAENNKQNTDQSSTDVTNNNFSKGLVKDYNETFVADGFYTHARNAVNNSHDGQVGVIGNEPSNLFCVTLPYTMIGCIHLTDDQWVIFTTDDIHSEIGIFDESACTYKKVVNSDCLNFKKSNLITGAYRKRFDCERLIYWDDGLNPTRTMDLDKVPFTYTIVIVNGCETKVYTTNLDCEAIRLAPLLNHPCIKLSKGNLAGTLPNGSYQVCIAYSINQVKVSDYIGLSEVQSLWTHQNVSSSLEVNIVTIDDKRFDEFELVVVSNINGQTLCKRIGYYSTVSGTIYIDRWDLEYVTIPISNVVLRTDPLEKTDAMYVVNNYLLRVGTHSKYKFNYQLQANNITTKWAAVQYPNTYYTKGGNNTSYLRDEQYAFFIRWIYNTGERSESYNIPGRASLPGELDNIVGDDAFETQDGILRQRWQVENTATIDSIVPYSLPDGGVVIETGRMGYWESTEHYPNDKFDIWGPLCGKAIRHHKMPDVTVGENINHFNHGANLITLLGVSFSNITHPLDQNGIPIDSIIGYEILRGSREGAKSIIAKGLINNMRSFTIPDNPNITGLYQNYPYNDLHDDVYLTSKEQTSEGGANSDGPNGKPLTGYKQDVFSFHSPELAFSIPYLNPNEIKVYEELRGTTNGTFSVPYMHPKFKLLTNKIDGLLDDLAGLITAIQLAAAALGSYTQEISSEPGLPTIKLGIGNVMSDGGPFGAVGVAMSIVAIATNVTFQGIYVGLFGSKINKQQLLGIIYSLIPNRQFATQYNSHGLYNDFIQSTKDNRRRKVEIANYVQGAVQQFTDVYQINNQNRSVFVCVKIKNILKNTVKEDNSRVLLGNGDYNTSITTNIASHYAALKISIPSQYGQIESIKQISISECINSSRPTLNTSVTSPIFFGGDTYIGRFTEKNSMLFFNTWLMGEPNAIEFDYTLYPNLPYPRFWVNSQKYIGLFADKPSNHRSLDGVQNGNWTYLNKGHFYLFNSGVRDFYVESEVNLAYRDWEDDYAHRHYDPYGFTDLISMFRSDIIKSGNYYKYDYSLSIAKLVNSHITWGEVLPRNYNPVVAATCYTYRPNRVVYSLPQQDESKQDSWRVFLTNNYKDFNTNVTAIKPINKTGAVFMMKFMSPLQFMGVEELKLDGTGVKVTIGDGALFSGAQQLQSIVNADESYEYGSCQSRYSVLGTSKGVFWVSQSQGKIYNYAGEGLKEISNQGLKWWFAKYLPSELLKVYPDYPLYDNPVIGVGVHAIYDNVNEIVYICKRDYKPLVSTLTYDQKGNFYVGGKIKISITDKNYFEDASWTISYDTKSGSWLSFHDWVPTFLLPGKAHFTSVNNNTIWKHNIRCDSYCNFYDVNYPFEIEYVSATGQTVNTIRSIEYLLEVYKYYNDCRDRFHVLDENFDRAIIYNSEQISGLLTLKSKQKNDPLALLSYPIITNGNITIQYSKEENKYRFNQFWDITKDRGEFTGFSIPLLNLEANGYKYSINPNAVNYNKSPLERKKFRHNVNRVWLSKTVSGNLKFLFKTSNQKLLQSPR